VVPKGCFAEPKGSATSSQGILGYISVRPTVMSTNFLNYRKNVVKNNRGTSLIGDMFISYDR